VAPNKSLAKVTKPNFNQNVKCALKIGKVKPIAIGNVLAPAKVMSKIKPKVKAKPLFKEGALVGNAVDKNGTAKSIGNAVKVSSLEHVLRLPNHHFEWARARSSHDVPAEVKPKINKTACPVRKQLIVASDCSGLGTDGVALRRLGVPHRVVFASDISSAARAVLAGGENPPDLIHDDMRSKKSSVDPLDLYSAGFPCQPFSAAGKNKGSTDNRDLSNEVCAFLIKAQTNIFVLENVNNILFSTHKVTPPNFPTCGD
jgi:hypothetical protein